MKTWAMPCALVALAVVALMGTATVTARGRDDHDRARQAVESGQVMPLKALLARVEREHPGQVLEVELEQDDGVWRYEIKLLQPGGVLNKLKLDARTGAVVKSRAQRAGSRERERGRDRSDHDRERD
jgi:uncharacterized membrane protein YkoI